MAVELFTYQGKIRTARGQRREQGCHPYWEAVRLTGGVADQTASIPINQDTLVGRVVVIRIEPFNTQISSFLAVGDDVDADAYIATLNLKTTGTYLSFEGEAVSANGKYYSAPNNLQIAITDTGDDPTTGDVYVLFECIPIARLLSASKTDSLGPDSGGLPGGWNIR